MVTKFIFHGLAIISTIFAAAFGASASNNKIVLIVVSLTIAGIFEIAITFLNLSPKDNGTKANGDPVRDSVKTKSDYIKGDKIVVNQPIIIAGDFISIAKSTSSESTSLFVSIILSLEKFARDRKSLDGPVEVDDYLEWVYEASDSSFLKEHSTLFEALNKQDDHASLIRSYISNMLRIVIDRKSAIKEILENTNKLPDINSKLDFILDQLSKKNLPYIKGEQLAISAKVLDILIEGVVGSGFKAVLKKVNIAHQGTTMIVWLLGTQSPNLMLLDLVGDIHSNRISLILNDDSSVRLRAYDASGDSVELNSISYLPGDHLVIIATWEGKEVSLWVNGKHQRSGTMTEDIDYLGPACLIGLDIEGMLSADSVRWTPEGQEVGLNFEKDGIWHGSRWDTTAIWERVLSESEIGALAENPYHGLKPPPVPER